MQQTHTAKPWASAPAWVDAAERRASIKLCGTVLLALTAAKAMAPVPYVGPVALAGAAFWQLRAPLGRIERRGLGIEALGVSLRAWRRDVGSVLALAAVFLPLYALAYHLWATGIAGRWLPRAIAPQGIAVAHWAPSWPAAAAAWARNIGWLLERCATHFLGVALPEEIFYRGYLQPVWQSLPSVARRPTRARLGWPTLAANAAFALGHVLGEWHFARLGPFFPGLLFAWQRQHSGTILGAVGLHGLCNIFAEVWARLYAM